VAFSNDEDAASGVDSRRDAHGPFDTSFLAVPALVNRDRGRLVRLRPLLPATAVALLAGGCGLPSFGAPEPASEQGRDIYSLWQASVVAALAVGAFVLGLIVFTLVRFRRRNDDVPRQNPYNVPIEVLYTVVPVLIVAVLFGFTVATQREVEATGSEAAGDAPTVDVEVVGFQWQWQFRYPGEGVVVTGTTSEPPELVLPVDERARLELVAEDVIHSFWVPRFLYKRDLIPGVDNAIEITPDTEGTYEGRCAEFCGLDHWRMYFSVRVVSAEEYERWLDDQRSEGDGQGEDEGAASPRGRGR